LFTSARYHVPAPRLTTLAIALLATGLTACRDDDTTPPTVGRTIAFSFAGLEPLANGFHYEGWVILNGQPVSTGKFNLTASGGLVALSGTPIPNGAFVVGRDVRGSSAVVLTVEPNGDTDALPADSKLMGGSVTGGSAAMSVAFSGAIGNSFASVAGNYVLATPTSAATTDELSGIWFMRLVNGAPQSGLTLPTLPTGWIYEGWAVINGRPVTTGRFTSVSLADLAAPFSGPGGGPPFPGEDFITNAPAGLTFPTSLRGGMAVISIEPQPDDSPAPFAPKPLLAMITADAAQHVTHAMAQNLGSLPTGTATIR